MKCFEQPDFEIITFEYEDIMDDVIVSGPVDNVDSEDGSFWD